MTNRGLFSIPPMCLKVYFYIITIFYSFLNEDFLSFYMFPTKGSVIQYTYNTYINTSFILRNFNMTALWPSALITLIT